MMRVTDAKDDRVAHVDVGRGHVDLQAQHMRAVGELARLHAAEQVEVFLGRAIPIWAVASGLGERPAERSHLVGGEAVYVGAAVLDEQFAVLVEFLEVVRRVEEIRAPVETEPLHRIEDRLHVLRVFGDRIGVIETHVAAAVVIARQTEIEADRLGVADVQIPIRLGREARADPGRVLGRILLGSPGPRSAAPGARSVFPAGEVGFHDVANEVRDMCVAGGRRRLVRRLLWCRRHKCWSAGSKSLKDRGFYRR